MKLLSLVGKDRVYHVGALIEGSSPDQNKVLDFYELEPKALHLDMLAFIRASNESLPWAKAMIEKAKAGLVPTHALFF